MKYIDVNKAILFCETSNVTLPGAIDVQYRQSESDGESHETSFMEDSMEFFFKIQGHVTNIHIHIHNVINANFTALYNNLYIYTALYNIW